MCLVLDCTLDETVSRKVIANLGEQMHDCHREFNYLIHDINFQRDQLLCIVGKTTLTVNLVTLKS